MIKVWVTWACRINQQPAFQAVGCGSDSRLPLHKQHKIKDESRPENFWGPIGVQNGDLPTSRFIPLPSGGCAIVSPEDYTVASRIAWRLSSSGYVIGSRRCENKLRLHRLITGAAGGQFVDHINGNRLDNRRENLRICNNTQNIRNQGKRRGRMFKGITRQQNGLWRAQIMVDRKKCNLGSFIDPQDAARVYDAAAVRFFGEYARLNFPASRGAAVRG